MKKRFIILVDDATREQQNAVTLFFKGKFGYWHHFSDAWLVSTTRDEWTTAKIRDELKSVVPGPNILVLEIEAPNAWAGFGKKGMFDWFREASWSSD